MRADVCVLGRRKWINLKKIKKLFSSLFFILYPNTKIIFITLLNLKKKLFFKKHFP